MKHVEWTIWHQGASPFVANSDNWLDPDTLKGLLLDREADANGKSSQGYFEINNATPSVILAAAGEAVVNCAQGKIPEVPAYGNLQEDLRWVMCNKGRKQYFIELMSRPNFEEIRKTFSYDQQHDDNKRNVLACYNASQIRELINMVSPRC